jgi:hypothetical protein
VTTQIPVKIGFRQEIVELPLEELDALKSFERKDTDTKKYRQLKASLEHVGLIEPFAVYPQTNGRYLVVNGNLRLHILRKMAVQTARCTVAFDDESYTYNKRVNALSPITEHFMILKAIGNGVTEERIASALNVDVKAIKQKRNLLDGICPEVIELLKDKRASSRTFSHLRKMKPIRQIEAAELMVAGKNYTASFAESILGVTDREQLVKMDKEPSKNAEPSGSILVDAQEHVAGNLAAARKTYGADVLSLAVVCRSLETLFTNKGVKKYLSRNHAELLEELENLIEAVNSDKEDANRGSAPTDRAWPTSKKPKACVGQARRAAG